jgi:anti-sigma factor RsiW
MDSQEAKNQEPCPAADISAYIDGELAPDAEVRLEAHLAVCPSCLHKMNQEKGLLLVLDSTFDGPETFELPEDFSKVIVANAESRVSGLRRPRERVIAALVCLTLAFLSVFAFGNGSGRAFGALTSGLQSVIAVFSTAGHFVFDLSLGTAVIFRSLFSNFIMGSTASALVFAVVFLGAFFIFTRLFFRQSGT